MSWDDFFKGTVELPASKRVQRFTIGREGCWFVCVVTARDRRHALAIARANGLARGRQYSAEPLSETQYAYMCEKCR